MDTYIYRKSINTFMIMMNTNSRGVLPPGRERGEVVKLGLS